MSLPLTRRIVRTALLIAAGAAPVVGAAGAAGAAELPQAPELGGLTTVDGAGLGKAVDGASQQGAVAGGKVVGTTLPVATKTVGDTGAKAAPAAAKSVGKATAGDTTAALGDATGAVTKGGLPTQGLPIG
ncbi:MULTISPECIES: ATP-binding protein [unclassified Streptomyces]|uniref:ATP-binding protein n=1 Tax=unclassified Streptomyces TaxID=2593676 RepID=UPI0020345892|nr:ATP-binding protein [Streptomyces sp. RKAG290]MCM2411927.1 ATP-binding protein [Streptomyces sp. RKAG290]